MPQSGDLALRIEKLKGMGMSRELICSRLMIEGWSEGAIRQCFPDPELPPHAEIRVERHVETAAPASPSRVEHHEVPASGGSKLLPAVLGVFFVIFVSAGAAAYMTFRPPVVYSISIPTMTLSSSTIATLSYGTLPARADPGYYDQVKNALIAEKATFIDANLSSMRLRVYKDGVAQVDVSILAKGKVGSWWETPTGIYKIESKEWNHFSSFGAVDMPFSMGFQGNFFIHGWPTYADGTPVESTYSGGCIRLSTDSAKLVYGQVEVGTPVIVYNEPVAKDAFTYNIKPPQVSASAYLVADAENGTVLASKNATVAAPIASLTKLMMALVATEYINLDKEVVVPAEAIVYTSVPRLKAGGEVRAYDLLHLVLKESSNEASETLASTIGRAAFIKRMNEKASAIGLDHTVFSDPSGAKGDYSTPEDLFKLLQYILENRSFIFSITSGGAKDTAYGNISFKNVQNFNDIAGTKLVGGKIGQTREAKETYAGVFSIPFGSEMREIAIVVLGSADSTSDVRKLHDFAKKSYE